MDKTECQIIEECPHFMYGNCQEYLDGDCSTHKCDLKIIRELQQKLQEKEQECEELKKGVIKQCPICGEQFLTKLGAELYEENKRLKQEVKDLKEQLETIELRRAEIEKKMQELTNVVCNTDCKTFVLPFTLITENINYVATGKIKLTEREQYLMIREFLNNIKVKDIE